MSWNQVALPAGRAVPGLLAAVAEPTVTASPSRAVLEHLAMAGPLTIGEAAAHLDRAQSVISEIVSHLEEQGLLERESDPADRRRTLIWLTPAGHSALRQDRELRAGRRGLGVTPVRSR